LFFLIFFLLTASLRAQTNTPGAGYTRCTWAEIQLMDSSYHSTDSAIVFVTTRSVQNTPPVFLTNNIASDSTLHFFIVYFRGNQWKAAPRPSLAEALKGMGDKQDYLVYTEGDGKTFPDNVDRSTRMTRLYKTNVIMFDWPTRVTEYNGIQNIHNTAHNAKSLARQYHTFLLTLKDFKATRPEQMAHISLFFHSMGNAVFKNYVTHYGTSDLGKGLVNNLIFNAACVSASRHRQWMETLNFQDHIYVTYNRKDRTLRAASWLFHKRMMGCQLHRPLAANAMYINIHPLVQNHHNYFLDQSLLSAHPQILRLYGDFFHVLPILPDNPALFIKARKGRGYTLL
jgi:hypothetical protein